MILSIVEVRKMLGEKAKNYTDSQLEEIITMFTVLADMVIDSYLAKKKKQ